ncbi:MAG: hypothetical protein ACREO8_10900, partial [Luteimonas sp.]
WTPDWLADFPLEPFDSMLVVRMQRGDTAFRELPASLAPAWERWQVAVEAERGAPQAANP